MGEVKHTPGPWAATDNGYYWQIDSAEGQVGDTCASKYMGDHTAENPSPREAANARLIAASPCLLEALKELRRVCSDIPAIERNPRFAEANRVALAAIARATGSDQ